MRLRYLPGYAPGARQEGLLRRERHFDDEHHIGRVPWFGQQVEYPPGEGRWADRVTR
jgi:hypothetical protein